MPTRISCRPTWNLPCAIGRPASRGCRKSAGFATSQRLTRNCEEPSIGRHSPPIACPLRRRARRQQPCRLAVSPYGPTRTRPTGAPLLRAKFAGLGPERQHFRTPARHRGSRRAAACGQSCASTASLILRGRNGVASTDKPDGRATCTSTGSRGHAAISNAMRCCASAGSARATPAMAAPAKPIRRMLRAGPSSPPRSRRQ